MPKKTRRSMTGNKKTRKVINKKRRKMVSFASRTAAGEPVKDHSRIDRDLFKGMQELKL